MIPACAVMASSSESERRSRADAVLGTIRILTSANNNLFIAILLHRKEWQPEVGHGVGGKESERSQTRPPELDAGNRPAVVMPGILVPGRAPGRRHCFFRSWAKQLFWPITSLFALVRGCERASDYSLFFLHTEGHEALGAIFEHLVLRALRCESNECARANKWRIFKELRPKNRVGKGITAGRQRHKGAALRFMDKMLIYIKHIYHQTNMVEYVPYPTGYLNLIFEKETRNASDRGTIVLYLPVSFRSSGVYYWAEEDSIPPSGMAFYQGGAFENWEGDLLIGSLRDQYIARFEINGKELFKKERILENRGWRIRDIRVNPADGFLYVLVDNPDAPLVRVRPAQETDNGR